MVSGNQKSFLTKLSHNINAAHFSSLIQQSSQCSAHQLLSGANFKLTEDQHGQRSKEPAAAPLEAILDQNVLKLQLE